MPYVQPNYFISINYDLREQTKGNWVNIQSVDTMKHYDTHKINIVIPEHSNQVPCVIGTHPSHGLITYLNHTV